MNDFRLLMLSAMYENGGNTTHRLLDGHPHLWVYPFESQLGTRLVNDGMASLFPVKYRWPVFALGASVQDDYRAIIDEECKVRARTPHVSKFRHAAFDFSDDDRMARFARIVGETGRSTGDNVAAFFRATFEAWKDYRRPAHDGFYVGYSPIIGVDADKILRDLPGAHVLHVVRNPWSAYADTKKRPVPMSLRAYVNAWGVTQHHALAFAALYPDRMHILRAEDIFADPVGVLGGLCERLGLPASPTLATPTWNGEALPEVYPWGTIRRATPEANLATARELSAEEREAVRLWADPYLDRFGYRSFGS